MTSSCVGCSCESPSVAPPGDRLVLATQVDHTSAALRTLALRNGLRLRPLAPGLLAMDTDRPQDFLALAREALSSVEADEVRCAVLPGRDLPDVALLGQALRAPSLATAGARVAHSDLLPLFADEDACFHAVYQPIVDLPGRTQVGVEALLRATAPDGRAVLPDELFPAAHAAGWTHLVDRVGRTTALRDAGAWLPADQLLFINFIPTSIYRPEVCLRTTEIAARQAGVDLGQVVFEVTEGHHVRDVDHLEKVFEYYRSHGCKVALDDLGSGYSSLNMLVRLLPDIVKLDKDLVQGLPHPTSRAVMAAIVDITHSYGGRVLAECVETEEQAQVATDLGVDLGQGWLFGRPQRPAEAGGRVRPARGDRARPRAGREVAVGTAVAAPDPTRPDPAVAVVVPHQLVEVSPGPAGMSELLVRAVDTGVNAVVVADLQAEDHPMLYVNPAFEQMTGYSAAEVVGRNCRMLQGEGTDPATVRELSLAIRRGEEHRCVIRNYRKDGTAWWNELHLSPVRDRSGALTHYLGYQHDVTARIETEEALAHQATRDGLTGLANRSHLFARLQDGIEEATRARRALAVLFLDLDGFKAVNDTHGHAAGDGVLVQVAERLRASLRARDLICRNGGDEFVAVLFDLDPLDALRVAERAAADVGAALRRPFVVDGGTTALGGSVGISVFPDDGASADALLALADADMYRTKRTRHRTTVGG